MAEKKLNLSTGNTQTNMQLEQHKMGILQNSKMFAILSNGLYPDEFHAIIRELLCNAYDATLDAGGFNLFNRVKIYIYRDRIVLRDYGIGLTKEKFVEIMPNYGLSTKEFNEEAIGALGLGSKSPFAYADMFYINSYKDGICLQALSSVEDGEPAFNILSETPTDERNGIEYIIPLGNIDDYNKFIVAAWEVFEGFDNADQIVDFQIEKRVWCDETIDEKDGVPGCHTHKLIKQEITDDKRFLCSIYSEELGGNINIKLKPSSSYNSSMIIQMSNILYTFKDHEVYSYYFNILSKMLTGRSDLVIQIPNNKLTFTPCRFNLKYDKLTVERLTGVLSRSVISVTRMLKKFSRSSNRLSLPTSLDAAGMHLLAKNITTASKVASSVKFGRTRLNLESLDLKTSTNRHDKSDFDRLSKIDKQRVYTYIQQVIDKNNLTKHKGYIMIDYVFSKHKRFEDFMKAGEIIDTIETVKYYDYKLGNLNYTLRDLILEREKSGLRIHSLKDNVLPESLTLIRLVKQYDNIKLSCTVSNATDLLDALNEKIKKEQNSKVLYPLFNSVTKVLNANEISDMDKVSVKARIVNSGNGVIGQLRSDKGSIYEYFSISELSPKLLGSFKYNANLPKQMSRNDDGTKLHHSKKIIVIPTLVDQVKILKTKCKEIRDMLAEYHDYTLDRSNKTKFEMEANVYNLFIRNVIDLNYQKASIVLCNGRDKKNLIPYLEDQYPTKEIVSIEFSDLLTTKILKQVVGIMKQQSASSRLATASGKSFGVSFIKYPRQLAMLMHNLNVTGETEQMIYSNVKSIIDIITRNFGKSATLRTNVGIIGSIRTGDYDKSRERLKRVMEVRQRNNNKIVNYLTANLYVSDSFQNIVNKFAMKDDVVTEDRNAIIALLDDIDKLLLARFNIIERRFIRSEFSSLHGNISRHDINDKVSNLETRHWYASNQKTDEGVVKRIKVLCNVSKTYWSQEGNKTNMILKTITGKPEKHYNIYEQNLLEIINAK